MAHDDESIEELMQHAHSSLYNEKAPFIALNRLSLVSEKAAIFPDNFSTMLIDTLQTIVLAQFNELRYSFMSTGTSNVKTIVESLGSYSAKLVSTGTKLEISKDQYEIPKELSDLIQDPVFDQIDELNSASIDYLRELNDYFTDEKNTPLDEYYDLISPYIEEINEAYKQQDFGKVPAVLFQLGKNLAEELGVTTLSHYPILLRTINLCRLNFENLKIRYKAAKLIIATADEAIQKVSWYDAALNRCPLT